MRQSTILRVVIGAFVVTGPLLSADLVTAPPVITGVSVEGGPRTGTLEIQLNASIARNPSEYRAWEKGDAEPAVWMPLAPPISGRIYAIPFTLKAAGGTLGSTRVVYLRARNGAGESRPFATQILLAPPVIAAMGPTSAAAGSSEEILLRGSFGAADGPASVTFDGVPAEIVSWGPAEIRCLVPLNVQGGSVPVVVTSQCGLQSSARRFRVQDFWAHTWTGEY
jgi:hypothetical protein